MTKYYSVNKQYATGDGASCIYDLVNTLVSASWTIQSASDGSSFDAGTTYWTPTSLKNNYAWVTVREPTGPGGREWCFQRISNDYTWRVKVSPYASFTGSATATQVPTASDEGLIWGSGTDASPTGTQLFNNGINKFHIIAESTPVGPVGNQVYGFWSFHNIAGSYGAGYLYGFICQEPLAVGSYPALVGTRAATTSGDADPCLYGCMYAGSAYTFANYFFGGGEAVGTSNFKYFYKYQNASGSLTYAYDVGRGSYSAYNYPIYVGPHPCSGEDVGLPITFGRQTIDSNANAQSVYLYTFNGLKGTTNNLKNANVNRSSGTVVNFSTNAYIYLYYVMMPWPENVVPEL